MINSSDLVCNPGSLAGDPNCCMQRMCAYMTQLVEGETAVPRSRKLNRRARSSHLRTNCSQKHYNHESS